MVNKFLITFAGVVGSSKTPIAHYLSWKLNLPIFSNDAIRTEIIEDLDSFNEEEYKKRRDQRLEQVAKSELSFIYDASVDREWSNLKRKIEPHGYRTFIISLDLSKEFLISLHKTKGYQETLERIDSLAADHNTFLVQYKHEIGLCIQDKDFADRLKLSYQKVKNWLIFG